MTLQEMIREARELSTDELKQLMKVLIDMMPPAEVKQHSILEFEGIAAHLADEEDPQEYMKRLRSEWDERP